ncbi:MULTISPECIES: nuclear transport factor 2 family protein [Paenibacillus]|uniref:SnoaL-like domain-containing protein n=1 Tax=Paenibacillus albilobatus TaxID=2716884 RepID=A0A919XKL8_9BACL|nr:MULTISPECIES: nuclear transport factor 2 family protein [Paenibacillus]GIO33494.1 hypothetical protein J2TS6_46350 [Paenibacillus albilobatus]
MNSEQTKAIIEAYLNAYNSFDVEGMLNLLHEDVVFRNFANGELNTETKGKEEFRQLAEQSTKIFSSRRQTITDYQTNDDKVKIQIDYEGTLAVDLPNGLKSGETLQLKGKSVFEFKEGKIAVIEDYS